MNNYENKKKRNLSTTGAKVVSFDETDNKQRRFPRKSPFILI